jgi:hypothetical protein
MNYPSDFIYKSLSFYCSLQIFNYNLFIVNTPINIYKATMIDYTFQETSSWCKDQHIFYEERPFKDRTANLIY